MAIGKASLYLFHSAVGRFARAREREREREREKERERERESQENERRRPGGAEKNADDVRDDAVPVARERSRKKDERRLR
jgi:DNA-binding IclR family transcriptional regulator